MKDKEITLKDKINEFVLGCDGLKITGIGLSGNFSVKYKVSDSLYLSNGILTVDGTTPVSGVIVDCIKSGRPANAIIVKDKHIMVANVSQVNGEILIHPHTLDGLDIYRTPSMFDNL